MLVKKNVTEFDRDISDHNGYQYTNSDKDISKYMSNSRTSAAITNSTCFSGKKVLDIGCGDGVFTLELMRAGAASVLGVDPASNAIESAKRRALAAGMEGRVRFEAVNLYDLEGRGEQFDIAVLRGVLHHVPLPEKAVAVAAAVADELIILEPNGCNPVLKLIERFSAYHRLHEEQSFLPSTIDRWLERAGKTPTNRQLINLVPLFCPPAAARILKILEPIVEATPVLRLFGCGQYLVKGA